MMWNYNLSETYIGMAHCTSKIAIVYKTLKFVNNLTGFLLIYHVNVLILVVRIPEV